jgi:hypothetical protein
MSAAYYDAETEILTQADGTPFGVRTRVFATTNQREIAAGVVREVTETREVASFYNRIVKEDDDT